MYNSPVRNSVKSVLFVLCCAVAQARAAVPAGLQQWIDAPQRSAENKARDQYRHPAETLGFFGLQPQMKVLEIWPARGWYTEILAPYLKERGELTIANFRHNDGTLEDDKKIFWAKLSARLDADIRKNPQHFGKLKSLEFQHDSQILRPSEERNHQWANCASGHQVRLHQDIQGRQWPVRHDALGQQSAHVIYHNAPEF